ARRTAATLSTACRSGTTACSFARLSLLSVVVHLVISTADRRMKRGDVRLRPVKPTPKTERWYRGQLTAIVRELAAWGRELLRDVRRSWPTVRDAVPPTAKETIKRGRHRFQVQVPGAGVNVAAKLVDKVRDDVDVQIVGSVRASIGVDIRAALMNEA